LPTCFYMSATVTRENLSF